MPTGCGDVSKVPSRDVQTTIRHLACPRFVSANRTAMIILLSVYFARLQISSALPPVDAAATHVSWSPVSVKGRFCSVPSQLAKKACSILKRMVLSDSLTEYLPQWGFAPCTAALFSSAVPSIRLFDANFG